MEKEKKQKNGKPKQVGNGNGSLYFSEKLQKWIYQYVEPNGKRQTMTQRKNESATAFKKRVTEIKGKLDNGTYIERNKDTVYSILENYIRQKFNDGITKGTSYKRDKETLQQINSCCSSFIKKPIQKVTLYDIQNSKENMKKYSQSVIDKLWRLLKKAFSIASSPSVKLIPYNIMNDENLKKPISNKETRKVYPLQKEEREKLEYILDNQEKHHKYRNIVKMEWITAMRIGEVLARSTNDIDNEEKTFHIHNTLSEDENGSVILGEHTKTFNKKTGIDEGERYFPINQGMDEIIKSELSKKISNIHELLFWDYDKNTFINDQEVNAWLKRINAKYKICKGSLHNHRLRHDRITQWIEVNMSKEAIQYLAGHVEGSEITDDYIDVSKEFAFKELEKAN